MPSPPNYRQWVRLLDWHGIQQMWLSLRAGPIPGWPAGRAFEHLILRAFELDGAEVTWPYTVSAQQQVVEQIDGAVYAAGLSCLVEAKDSSRPVRFDVVTRLRDQLSRRPAGVLGLLFSRSSFTDPAVTLARFLTPQNILLWSGSDLTVALERRSMVRIMEAKYRSAVEKGTAKYEIRSEGTP